ncbi:hypothetical protein D3C71_1481430 [compost metagenome]
MHAAIAVDAPELAVVGLGPVRIARVQRAIRCQCDVVGLVRAGQVREHADRARCRIDPQDVVARVVGHEHRAVRAEADAVADAAFGQGDEQCGSAVGIDAADGAVLADIDDIQRAVRTGGRAFDAGGEHAVADVVAHDKRCGSAGAAGRTQAQGNKRSLQRGRAGNHDILRFKTRASVPEPCTEAGGGCVGNRVFRRGGSALVDGQCPHRQAG